MQYKKELTIRVISEGEEYEFHTYPNSHKSLMALLFDELDLEEFGECKGMGRCGTCRIRILEQHPLKGSYEDNETSTLKKMENSDPDVRLSCRIQINEAIDQLYVEII